MRRSFLHKNLQDARVHFVPSAIPRGCVSTPGPGIGTLQTNICERTLSLIDRTLRWPIDPETSLGSHGLSVVTQR